MYSLPEVILPFYFEVTYYLFFIFHYYLGFLKIFIIIMKKCYPIEKSYFDRLKLLLDRKNIILRNAIETILLLCDAMHHDRFLRQFRTDDFFNYKL